MPVPNAIAALEKERDRAPSEDSLKTLRAHAMDYRNLVDAKATAEEQLKEISTAIQDLEFKTIPGMMDELGLPRIDLKAEGNLPAIKIEAKPYYRANIAADWPEDKRKAAFDWLTEDGSGDLIKTSVAFQFAREDRAKAIKFAKALEAKGYLPTVKESVAWGTLTAWLKESIEKHSITPPLDTFGATVGRRATIKEI